MSLVSFTLSSVASTMKRWEITQAMQDLGVLGEPPPALRVTQAFRDAGAATTLEYAGDTGRRVVRMKASGKDDDLSQVRDLISCDVADQDAAPVRVGQVKLLLPRQNTLGVVHGSHSLRLTVGQRQGQAEKDAAAAWMVKLREDFAGREVGMLPTALRKMIRSCMTALDGVPVLDRAQMYYVYADRLDEVDKVARLQDIVTPGGSIVTWALDPGCDELTQLIATAADQYLLDLLIRVENDAVASTVSQRTVNKQRQGLRSLSAALHTALEGIAVHEERLGIQMFRARGVIASVEDKVRSLAPGGFLPSVT